MDADDHAVDFLFNHVITRRTVDNFLYYLVGYVYLRAQNSLNGRYAFGFLPGYCGSRRYRAIGAVAFILDDLVWNFQT